MARSWFSPWTRDDGTAPLMRRDVLAVRTGGCGMMFMTLAADSWIFLYFVFLLMLVDIGWYWTYSRI
jgi:hypothetical protein